MNTDEKEIRELVQKLMTATKASDTPTVLSLMTDDVVFLVPGQPPMMKETFASLSAEQSKAGAPKIDGTSEIQEIKVLGDWGFTFMWTMVGRIMAAPHRMGNTFETDDRWSGRAKASEARP